MHAIEPKVTMKLHVALVSFAIALTLPGAYADTNHATPWQQAGSARRAQISARLMKAAPASLAEESAPAAKNLFPVNDEKGLLLTCVAPELDTNKDTDVFKHCTLAPGRSLDDVMHSFVGAMHEEERKLARQEAQSEKNAAAKSAEKAEQR
jgi:hypothetical protein